MRHFRNFSLKIPEKLLAELLRQWRIAKQVSEGANFEYARIREWSE